MRNRLRIGFFFVFLAVSLFGCNANNSSDATSPNRPQANMNTRATNVNAVTVASPPVAVNRNTAIIQDTFWIKAGQGGLAEVELAKLALQKSQNADVKKFAQTMIDDHGKADDELKSMAARKGVALPVEIGSHKSTLDALSGKTGAEFDKAYVDAMVTDHETTVELFEDNADNTDPDIKAFATKTLPTLRSHLEAIKAIQSKMK